MAMVEWFNALAHNCGFSLRTRKLCLAIIKMHTKKFPPSIKVCRFLPKKKLFNFQQSLMSFGMFMLVITQTQTLLVRSWSVQAIKDSNHAEARYVRWLPKKDGIPKKNMLEKKNLMVYIDYLEHEGNNINFSETIFFLEFPVLSLLWWFWDEFEGFKFWTWWNFSALDPR